MPRLTRVLTALLTATFLFAGCSAEPSATPADPDETAPGDNTPQPSVEPPPTEEPPELIGGGTELFPDKRFIALYGHPTYPELGALGEQGPQEAVERAQDLAEYYESHTDAEVIPAFEIIVTMASAAPGADGNYSAVVDFDDLDPYIEAAAEHDVYVVLDLQPGHNDFLTQAKIFEDYLEEPNVGLALDPEWRLAPGQVHMQQIGSVDAAEINETTEWLAELTAEHELPQKMVILHQFQLSMIQNREEVNTDHPELAIVLHADGHGTADQKFETWEALQRDLPDDIYLAWKNFYRQDDPMFSPQETFDVEPKPWFVSYQ